MADQCKCGVYEDEFCAECGGCDCPENLRMCGTPGCITIAYHEQWCDENGVSPSADLL